MSSGGNEQNTEPEMVNISLLPTGDLLEAFWHGMNGRSRLIEQLRMAKAASGDQPALAADIRFQASCKEAQHNLGLARDGCEAIKKEINIRFLAVDEMRFTMANAAEGARLAADGTNKTEH